MRRSEGFVLLNALILMAALSAAAVALLRVAEDSRTRTSLTRTADQARLFLDAAEPLALELLIRPSKPKIDHPGQAWATQETFQIGVAGEFEGEVAVAIHDLQARFNVNWLNRAEDVSSFAAFTRLLAEAGLPQSLADATRDFLTAASPQLYASRAVPLRPPAREFVLLEEWREVEGVTPAVLAALDGQVTAIPDLARINVNTISPEVFAVLFAPGRSGQVRNLFSRRAREPFDSVENFVGRAVFTLGENVAEDIDPARLSVSSDWFEVVLSAKLADVTVKRRLLVARSPNGVNVRVAVRRAER